MIKKLFLSFTYATKGVLLVFKERNFKIHLLALVSAILICIYLSFDLTDMAIIILTCTIVLTAEAFNTSIEELTDELRRSNTLTYKQVGKTKDIAAGAVLISAILAIVVGVLLLLKYI